MTLSATLFGMADTPTLTPREIALAKAVQAAMKEKREAGLTSAEKLAEAVGMSYNRLRHIFRLRTAITDGEIRLVREVLNLPKDWPEMVLPLATAQKGYRVSFAGTPLAELPIVGRVSAGPGAWNVDVENKVVRVPESMIAAGSVGFIVDGDSNMPFLHEFDVTAFKERRKPLKGYYFLMRSPSEGDVIKRTEYDRGDWYLHSDNESYPPYLMPRDTEIVGILVGVYRVNGKDEYFRINPDGLKP